MKTVLRVFGILMLTIIAIAAIGVSYLALRKPAQRAASPAKIEATPQRVERGRYLVQHVSICFDCHSERTMAYGLPVKPGSEGVRGFVWDRRIHFPGTLAAANLTPDTETGLGQWSDGEIVRAIREGVDRDGEALFPIMPYSHYRSMSDEDAQSIVAYLRTLKPQRYERPERKLDVPLNFIVKFIPQPLAQPVPSVSPDDHLAYGKYLATIAACGECHTPKDDKNNAIEAKAYAGGFEMHTPTFRVVSANITPHPSTYVGRASKEEFIGRFKAFQSVDVNQPAAPGKNTLMPWRSYAGLTESDLGAIYDYLKTITPVENQVNTFPDAK
jgi:mono/diheme cytochrome c family protein